MMTGSRENTSGLTSEIAMHYRKAADYCAIQDRCKTELLTKFNSWGIRKDESEDIIKRLLEEGFLDEKRFSVAYARGKFRNLHWGKIRIMMELKRRNIAAAFIKAALYEIDPDEYRLTAVRLFDKKMKELRSDTPQNKLKAIRFLAGKGFEPELIRQLVKEE